MFPSQNVFFNCRALSSWILKNKLMVAFTAHLDEVASDCNLNKQQQQRQQQQQMQ
jgi:hypothetical protein